MRAFIPLLVVFLLSAAAIGSENPITFCGLVRSPERFDGEEVTVRATYRYGFERSQLYCLDCLDKGRAWLEIPADIDDASEKAMKHAPKAGIVKADGSGNFSEWPPRSHG